MRDGTSAGFPERWWAGEAGLAGHLLDLATAPLEAAYRAAIRFRNASYASGRRSIRVGAPVVSVGNLSVGGAGKTPVTRWLVQWYERRGARPAVLHGGYALDEPELHRAWNPDVPVLVGRDRVASARAAVEGGATILILDDGFQHRRLRRDLDLVLVAAEGWDASPRLLPRGPWREPPTALCRADVVAVTRKTASIEEARRVAAEVSDYTGGVEPVILHLAPSSWRRGAALAAGPPPGEAVAVAGIAGPELFLENARSAGASLADTLIFRDHHDYDAGDVDRIRMAAAGRPVVTTAKDAVKLAPLAPDLDLWILEQDVIVDAGGDFLAHRLAALSV